MIPEREHQRLLKVIKNYKVKCKALKVELDLYKSKIAEAAEIIATDRYWNSEETKLALSNKSLCIALRALEASEVERGKLLEQVKGSKDLDQEDPVQVMLNAGFVPGAQYLVDKVINDLEAKIADDLVDEVCRGIRNE